MNLRFWKRERRNFSFENERARIKPKMGEGGPFEEKGTSASALRESAGGPPAPKFFFEKFQNSKGQRNLPGCGRTGASADALTEIITIFFKIKLN